MTTLDTAQLDVVNETNATLYFFRQFISCFKCPLIQTATLPSNQTVSSIMLKTFDDQFYAISNFNLTYIQMINSTQIDCLNYCNPNCRIGYLELSDQAKYRLTINHDFSSCTLDAIEKGRSNLYPFIFTILLYIVTVLLILFGCKYFRKRIITRTALAQGISPIDSVNGFSEINEEPSCLNANNLGRFNSIDSFRGLSVLLMIFVNYGAGEYYILRHAPWDGLHLADYVFPFFIFIMGTSIAVCFKKLALKSRIRSKEIFLKIVTRSIKLFLLGLIINSIGSADFSTIRIPGVLQRFSLSYGIVASVHLFSIVSAKRSNNNSFLQKLFRHFALWPEYLLSIIMGVLYFYFTFFWEFDTNCPIGYVGPGGLFDNLFYPNCVGGAAHKIDEIIFKPSHCYKGFFGSVLYDPERKMKLWHDPEGLLGTTTSVILTLIGLQVGHILVHNHEIKARLRKWIFKICVLVGLTIFGIFVLAIPINKNLWSLTFITITGAVATAIFSTFYILIDVPLRTYWPDGFPFNYAGQNAIFLYMGHEISRDMLPFTFIVPESIIVAGGHVGFLLRNLIGTTVWLIISVFLAKKGIFFTV